MRTHPPATGPNAARADVTGLPPVSPPSSAADALRYWERRRLVYNAALLSVVATIFAAHASRFADLASLDLFLALFLLAVLANVLFCAAYPVDLFVQRSGPAIAVRRVRLILAVVGTAFACVIAQFIARGIVGAP